MCARLSPLCYITFGVTVAMAGDVIFNEQGAVGAPASFGHISFSLRREDLHRKFTEQSWRIFHHFLAGTYRQNGTLGCDEPHRGHGHARHHHHCDLLHVVAANESNQKAFIAEMREIAITTQGLVNEMLDIVFSRETAHEDPRMKRQFVEIGLLAFDVVNFGFTMSNRHDIAVFRKKLANLEERVKSLILLNDEIVRTELRDHLVINQLLNTTSTLKEAIGANQVTGRYLAYKMAADKVRSEASGMRAAMALLHRGIISQELVNFTTMGASYESFKKMAAMRGMRPLFPSAESLLSAHAAYWTEAGALHFALPVPIVPIESKPLIAYRLEREPTSIPGPDGLQLAFVSDHQYILVNPDRSFFYPLTTDEWGRCAKMDGYTVCPEVRMRKDEWKSTCISTLFKGLPESRRKCEVKVRRAPDFEVKEVKAGLLRIMASLDKPTQWRVRCLGRVDNVTTTRNGTFYLRVDEGCVVYGPEDVYTLTPSTIGVEVKLEIIDQHDLELPHSLRAFDNWTDVRNLLDEHDVHDYIEATKLSELRERRLLTELQKKSALTDATYDTALIVVVAVLVTVSVGLAVWNTVTWRRLSALAALRREDMELAVKEPTAQVVVQVAAPAPAVQTSEAQATSTTAAQSRRRRKTLPLLQQMGEAASEPMPE